MVFFNCANAFINPLFDGHAPTNNTVTRRCFPQETDEIRRARRHLLG